MRQAVFLATVIFGAVGCANPATMEAQPHLDFGLVESDLSTETPDLAVDTGDLASDLGHASSDLAHDLSSATLDLTPPVDMLPEPSCDDSGTNGHLFLAAAAQGSMLVTARFDGASWTPYQSQASATDVAETLVAARPYVVARESNAALASAAADPCSQSLGSLAAIGSVTTAMRPALLPSDLVFRGATSGDTNLYYMTSSANTWGAPTKQAMMTTAIPFALIRFDGALRVFYDEGGNLTEGLPSLAAGGGTKSQVLSELVGQPPTAVVDGSGNLHVVYVGSNTNLQWVWKAPGGSYTHHTLCDGQSGCIFDTNLPIALAVDSGGLPIVAWAGTDKNVYVSRFLSTAGPQFWSAATLASGSCGTRDCQTTVGPALATGVGGAAAELVFVSDLDGRARHARLTTSWSQPVSIAGTNLLNTPALVSEP